MKKPWWKVGIICIAVIAIIGFGLARNRRKDELAAQATQEPGVSFTGVELVGHSRGVRQWELVSQTLRQEGKEFYLDNLQHVILLENEEPKYYVQANEGVWNPETGRLRLYNNVSVNGDAGFHLTTESLIWHNDKQSFEFFGTTSVVFEQGGEANE